MSELLPVFPLPNVVLFPGVFLPLHIFEPRYRDMIGDALLGDRIIGLALLRPGWERDYEGRPPVYPIGCSGVITHFERLPDGRYNIVLRGLERFRILQEDHTLSYRRAAVESLTDRSIEPADRTAVMNLRVKLQTLLTPAADHGAAEDAGSGGPYARATSAMPDEDLVNALAQYLDLEPLEKLALLQHDSVRARAESLVELLEMKILMARTPCPSSVAH
jgi:Lon protease-like protein